MKSGKITIIKYSNNTYLNLVKGHCNHLLEVVASAALTVTDLAAESINERGELLAQDEGVVRY